MTPAMKALVILIIGMGIAIMAALVLVAYGLVAGFDSEPTGFGTSAVEIPQGCELAESHLEEDRLVLRLAGPRGDCQQVILLDPQSGAEVGRVTIKQTAP